MTTPEFHPIPGSDRVTGLGSSERAHAPIRLPAFNEDGSLALRPEDERSWKIALAIDRRRQLIKGWEDEQSLRENPITIIF